jgi:hypothetical protein
MSENPTGFPNNGQPENAVPRVGTRPIDEFLRSNNSAFAVAMRRLIRDAESLEQNFAAFGNTP